MGVLNFAKLGWTQAFSTMKESVTLHTVTKSWDSNDDYTPSESNSTINAIIDVIDLDRVNDFGGMLNTGDAVGFFDSTTTVNIGDRITVSSVKYEIIKVNTNDVQGTNVFTECWLKRLS